MHDNRPCLRATFRLIYFAMFLLALYSSAYAETSIITVYYHNRPPLFDTENGTLGGIIGSRAQAVFKEAAVPCMFSLLPPKRQFLLLEQNQEKMCLVGTFYTPQRAQIGIYSKPIYRDRQRIVLTQAGNPIVRENISLKQIFADPRATLLVRDGYSYGKELDAMMARLKPRVFITSTNNASMVEMIHQHRADYMFISHEEADAILHASRLSPADFKFLVPPDTPEGPKRYLLFSKNVDMNIIRRIDAAIEKLYPLLDD